MSRSISDLRLAVQAANLGLLLISYVCVAFLCGVAVRSGFSEEWRAAIALAGLMLYSVSTLVWQLVRLHLARSHR